MKKIYSDGYTVYSNPSDKGGYVLTNSRGTPIFEGYYEKEVITNNEMELRGLVKACELADNFAIIIIDSYVAKCWAFMGKCKARFDLDDIALKACNLIKSKNLQLEQVPREKNKAGLYIENQKYENK